MQGLISYTAVGVDAEGRLDPEHIRAALTDATRLVSIMHSNNEVGSLQPIAEISCITRQHNILFHSDAAQSIGKVLQAFPLPPMLSLTAQAFTNTHAAPAHRLPHIAPIQMRKTGCLVCHYTKDVPSGQAVLEYTTRCPSYNLEVSIMLSLLKDPTEYRKVVHSEILAAKAWWWCRLS